MPGFELIGQEERDAVNKLFDDGGVLFAHGFDSLRKNRYHVRELEAEFAKCLGVKYAQAVSSGTAALKIALIALGVKPGDEVVTQAFTFIATPEAIIDIGAKPVFVNVDETLGMNATELEAAISDKTAAIIPVHMLGVAVNQDEIHRIARKNKIPILDDACESLGAEWNGEKLGAQADISTWSFDSGKTIIAGEGGMITTNDKELYIRAREYHDHGHMNIPNVPRGRDKCRLTGFNYRMTEVQAVIAKAQLKKLDFIVNENRRFYSILEAEFKKIKGVKFRKIPEKCIPLCDTLILQFDNKKIADGFVRNLNKAGLGTKNLPDAVQWHFALYWEHLFDILDTNKNEFRSLLKPSIEIIERSVAIPIMVKTSMKTIRKQIEVLKETMSSNY